MGIVNQILRDGIGYDKTLNRIVTAEEVRQWDKSKEGAK